MLRALRLAANQAVGSLRHDNSHEKDEKQEPERHREDCQLGEQRSEAAAEDRLATLLSVGSPVVWRKVDFGALVVRSAL